MQHASSPLAGLLLGLLLTLLPAAAQQHRATRLGNPATRFAPPLNSVDDLRSRFRDPKLRPDFAAVLAQWGWAGSLDDLFRAAETAEVAEWPIPVGERMPFMSSREGGRAICLKDVLWAGKEPAPAYAFNFTSAGRRYRCVTPKACSNFFLYDLGPEPKAALALVCHAPPREFTGRPLKVCFTLRNAGDSPEPRATITVPIPAGAIFASATEGGTTVGETINWEVANLGPNASREVCAVFTVMTPGRLEFKPVAAGAMAAPARCECQTQIIGVHAIGVEVIDLADPVLVGDNVTYVITVTNQGDQPGTNIRVVCTVPDSQEFVGGSGTSAVRAVGRSVAMQPIPVLEGKATATWRVQTKALRADDSRFRVEYSSDQFEKPIREDEATRLY